jgi:hypothetical protein
MKILNNIVNCKYSSSYILGLLLMLVTIPGFAQENPPIPIEVEVRTARFLDFGAFVTGNSTGTVHVSYDSTPTATGDVILINSQNVTSALFDVYALPGTIINIVPAASSFTLTGSNGGTMYLSIADSDFSTGPTFITQGNPNTPNEVYVGVDSANPPGNYTGTIIINFIQE